MSSRQCGGDEGVFLGLAVHFDAGDAGALALEGNAQGGSTVGDVLEGDGAPGGGEGWGKFEAGGLELHAEKSLVDHAQVSGG